MAKHIQALESVLKSGFTTQSCFLIGKIGVIMPNSDEVRVNIQTKPRVGVR